MCFAYGLKLHSFSILPNNAVNQISLRATDDTSHSIYTFQKYNNPLFNWFLNIITTHATGNLRSGKLVPN